MDSRTRLDRLKSMAILGALTDVMLEKIAGIAHEEEYEADTVIFREGDEGDSLFFILDGSVIVQKLVDSENERYKDLAVSEEGEMIGEMALFDHRPRSAAVRARTPLRVLRIYSKDFERFLQEDSASASAILGGLLSLQNKRLRDAAQQNVTLIELVNIIATVQDVKDLAKQVMERLMASLPHADAGAFCHWSPYMDDCEVLYARGAARGEEAVLAITRDGPMGKHLRQQHEPFIVEGVGADHPLHHLFSLQPRDSILVAPLLHSGDLLGYIMLVGRGMGFTSFHHLLVSAVAAPVSSALVNVRYAQEEKARGRLQTARSLGTQVSSSRNRPT